MIIFNILIDLLFTLPDLINLIKENMNIVISLTKLIKLIFEVCIYFETGFFF